MRGQSSFGVTRGSGFGSGRISARLNLSHSMPDGPPDVCEPGTEGCKTKYLSEPLGPSKALNWTMASLGDLARKFEELEDLKERMYSLEVRGLVRGSAWGNFRLEKYPSLLLLLTGKFPETKISPRAC